MIDLQNDDIVAQLLNAPLHSAFKLQRDLYPIPRTHGMYLWWINTGAIPEIKGGPHTNRENLELLYIGISSGRNSTLHSRLKQHLLGSSRRSTQRLTLASLLAPRMGWEAAIVNGRPALAPAFEAALTQFIGDSLHVGWISVPDPKYWESNVIRRLQPPINISHNSGHKYYAYVRSCRGHFRGQAFSRCVTRSWEAPKSLSHQEGDCRTTFPSQHATSIPQS